jgi:hypothetical protein
MLEVVGATMLDVARGATLNVAGAAMLDLVG